MNVTYRNCYSNLFAVQNMNYYWLLQLQFCFLVITHAHLKGIKKNECIHRDFGYNGTVCVCNATYCDELKPLRKLKAPNYQIFTSNKDGLRINRAVGVFGNSTATNELFKIQVNSDNKFQTIFGYGGAFTDAFGINLKCLSLKAQKKLMSSYFSKRGIEYNVGRVPIGGTDFSTVGYSYDDSEVEDPLLTNFSLHSEDFKYKIPLVKEAMALNRNLKLFATAWTAPKWMKTNNAYDQAGSIKDHLYQTWANYFKKFFDNYKKYNITFWGVTTGNEPNIYKFNPSIPSVVWTPETLTKWIGNNFGPTIRNSEYKDLKIMLLDDQRLYLQEFVNQIFQNETVKNYIDMIAVHWYTDSFTPTDVLDEMHQKYPDKHLIATEACIGDQEGDLHTALGSWSRGERYAADIIEDMQHHFVGWVDWNLALDPTGGPTFINNNVDSPIIVDETTDEFYRQPTFYVLGHFSKFVPRGSIRIDVSSNNNNSIPTTAFLRPDEGVVVIFLNKYENEVKVGLVDKHRGQISLTLSRRSISTVVYY